LHFAWSFWKAFGDKRNAVAALLFDRDNLSHKVPVRVPSLQHQAAIPFRNIPVLPNQRKRFFAGVKYSGLRRRGYEAFNDASQLGFRLHDAVIVAYVSA